MCSFVILESCHSKTMWIKCLTCTISHCHNANAALPIKKIRCWLLSNILYASANTIIQYSSSSPVHVINFLLFYRCFKLIVVHTHICWYIRCQQLSTFSNLLVQLAPLHKIKYKCHRNHISGVIIAECISFATHCILCTVHENLSSP